MLADRPTPVRLRVRRDASRIVGVRYGTAAAAAPGTGAGMVCTSRTKAGGRPYRRDETRREESRPAGWAVLALG